MFICRKEQSGNTVPESPCGGAQEEEGGELLFAKNNNLQD